MNPVVLPQKMGIWGNAGKTPVRGVSSVYVYMHSHTTIICELNSHQKTVSNLWHGAVGIRKPTLFINSYGFIHPSPPLFVLMWKGPMDQKRPRHSRQILATPRGQSGQIWAFEAKKLLGLKLRTKKQCICETILKRCYLLMANRCESTKFHGFHHRVLFTKKTGGRFKYFFGVDHLSIAFGPSSKKKRVWSILLLATSLYKSVSYVPSKNQAVFRFNLFLALFRKAQKKRLWGAPVPLTTHLSCGSHRTLWKCVLES